MKTHVIIRRENHGKTIYIFPRIPGDSDPNNCLCYSFYDGFSTCQATLKWSQPDKDSVYSTVSLEKHTQALLSLGIEPVYRERFSKTDKRIRSWELKNL